MKLFKNKVGRPSKETIRKRKIITGSLLLIVFVVVFSLTYTLANINTKRLKGESGPSYYGVTCEEGTACYNAGFRNGNLYQVVIDSYNGNNGDDPDLSYDDKITDEQMATIAWLGADNGNIDDATGIEKLVNLETLSLDNNNLSEINLSNNINLRRLDLSENNLSSINVSSLTNLEELELSSNNISEINLSNNINLTRLYLSENNLSSIDLSNNPNLTSLNLILNSLSEITGLNNLGNLTRLRLAVNNISTIDLSNNIYLEDLDLSYNNLNELDVSNLENLHELEIAHNNINNLVLNSNKKLPYLSIGYEDYINNNININQIEHIEIGPIIMLKNEIFDIQSELGVTDITNLEVEDDSISVNNNVLLARDITSAEVEFSSGEIEFSLNVVVSDAIESSKYNIDYENRYIYVGEDTEDEIINNITSGHTLLDAMGIDSYNLTISDGKLIIGLTDPDSGAAYKARPYTLKTTEDNNVIIPEPIDDENENGAPAPNLDDDNNNNNNNNNNSSNNNDNNSSNNNNNPTNDDVNNTIKPTSRSSSSKTTLTKFEDNAKTYDDIVKYFIIGGISIVLIAGILIYTKKKK